MLKKENLIFLVWEIDSIDFGIRYTSVTEDTPKGVTLNLEEGTWSFTSKDQHDPTTGKKYPIGGKAQTMGERVRVCDTSLPYGPIGCFDRTNIAHLNELVSAAEEWLMRKSMNTVH